MNEGYWLLEFILEAGKAGTIQNYPFKNLPTYTNKKHTTSYSYLILKNNQKKQAQKIWNRFISKRDEYTLGDKHTSWYPIGGDLTYHETKKDAEHQIKRIIKKFYRYKI